MLTSPAILAATHKLHLVVSTLAATVSPMTALALPTTDRASCEAALLFVWTLGLLVPSVMLASGTAAAAARVRPTVGARIVALLDGWLSQLQAPRHPGLHETTGWCLRWLLVLVCTWVACCVAVDVLP